MLEHKFYIHGSNKRQHVKRQATTNRKCCKIWRKESKHRVRAQAYNNNEKEVIDLFDEKTDLHPSIDQSFDVVSRVDRPRLRMLPMKSSTKIQKVLGILLDKEIRRVCKFNTDGPSRYTDECSSKAFCVRDSHGDLYLLKLRVIQIKHSGQAQRKFELKSEAPEVPLANFFATNLTYIPPVIVGGEKVVEIMTEDVAQVNEK
ncbi:hypothetical protein H5410_003183 [Solanum commersonii]|uniref:Uncharacterized protein n=1 Tax=Solanum commersonii TaxID=4109 RepID=A0A9J6B4E7_SOLCO|nr:hypothetical protein H5410_003183 [Solanum commersonii]